MYISRAIIRVSSLYHKFIKFKSLRNEVERSKTKNDRRDKTQLYFSDFNRK